MRQRRYPNTFPVGSAWAECLHEWDGHECMVSRDMVHTTHRCACGELMASEVTS